MSDLSTPHAKDEKFISIIVVDDNDADIELLKDQLETDSYAHNFHSLHDGEELLPYLENNPSQAPDLILLDINMPRMNGHEALQLLKKHPVYRKVPVAILTTSSNSADVELAREAGANGFIVKPGDFGYYDLVSFCSFAKSSPSSFLEVKGK